MYTDRKTPTAEERVEKTVTIEKKMLEIEERGVKLRLTIVDTPGFGDAVNNEQCWKPVEEFVDSQFEQYFKVTMATKKRLTTLLSKFCLTKDTNNSNP